MGYQPLCIQLPTMLEGSINYELKSRLIHLLPKFHDLGGEDPYNHLMEFLRYAQLWDQLLFPKSF